MSTIDQKDLEVRLMEHGVLTRNITKTLGMTKGPVIWMATDFGPLYQAATNAAIGTTYGHYTYGDLPLILSTKSYQSFDILEASQQFLADLNTTAQVLAKEYSRNDLIASLVVDPFKDRDNIVIEVQKMIDNELFTAHLVGPDFGQFSAVVHNPDWNITAAYSISKEHVPDTRLIEERDNLWDGHATYGTNAAIIAALGGQVLGTSIDTIRYFPQDTTWTADADELQQKLKPYTIGSSRAPALLPKASDEQMTQIHYHGPDPSCVTDTYETALLHHSGNDPLAWNAAHVDFIIRNILQDAKTYHLVVHEDAQFEQYVVAKITKPDTPLNITAIVPNDGSLSLLAQDYHIEGKVVQGNIEQVLDNSYKETPDEKPLLYDWSAKQHDDHILTHGYSNDDNGNLKLFLKPQLLKHADSIDVYQLIGGREIHVGRFKMQSNYDPHEDPACQLDENAALLAIPHPANGYQTDRNIIELAISCDSLVQRMNEQGIDLRIGPDSMYKITMRI